jgi:hypothetical protein
MLSLGSALSVMLTSGKKPGVVFWATVVVVVALIGYAQRFCAPRGP